MVGLKLIKSKKNCFKPENSTLACLKSAKMDYNYKFKAILPTRILFFS